MALHHLVVALVALAVAAVGCSSGDSDDTDDTSGRTFSVSAPDRWVERPERVEGISAVFYAAPEATSGPGDNVNIVERPSDGRSLDDIDEIRMADFEANAAYEVIQELSRITVGGQPASSMIWEGVVEGLGSEPLRFWIVWALSDGQEYVFAYRATSATFAANLDGATAILDSLEFR